MKTNNGYKFEIKNEVCILSIPIKEGEHNRKAQEAKREIWLNYNLPYFKKIVIKKIGTFKIKD